MSTSRKAVIHGLVSRHDRDAGRIVSTMAGIESEMSGFIRMSMTQKYSSLLVNQKAKTLTLARRIGKSIIPITMGRRSEDLYLSAREQSFAVQEEINDFYGDFLADHDELNLETDRRLTLLSATLKPIQDQEVEGNRATFIMNLARNIVEDDANNLRWRDLVLSSDR